MISKKKKRNNVANGVSTKRRDVTDLLNSLDTYGQVNLPTANVYSDQAISDSRFGFLDTMYPKGWMGQTPEEYDAIRRQQLDFARREYQGQLDPMEQYLMNYYEQYGDITASGSAEPVSPMTYVHPAGDLEAIVGSLGQIAEGNYLEGILGGSLALGSIFLPGTVQVGSTKGGGVFENMLDKQGRINKNSVLAIANKQGVNKGEAAVLNKVANKMPEDKIDYLDFKQMVSDELSFVVNETDLYSSYGVGNVYSPIRDINSFKVIEDIFDPARSPRSAEEAEALRLFSEEYKPDGRHLRGPTEYYITKKPKVDEIRSALSSPESFDEFYNNYPQRDGLPTYNHASSALDDLRTVDYRLADGDDANPLVNVLRYIENSRSPVNYPSSVYSMYAKAILMDQARYNAKDIAENPQVVYDAIEQLTREVQGAKMAKEHHNFANAKHAILSEMREAQKNIRDYISSNRGPEAYKVMQRNIAPFRHEKGVADTNFEGLLNKINFSEEISIEDQSFRIMEREVKQVSDIFPEYGEAVKRDAELMKGNEVELNANTNLLSSPSGNFPVSNAHFSSSPSAHVRSFESPSRPDAMFISELQSDALQSFKPLPQTVKNRLDVDKSLIETDPQKYVKDLLSTEGLGFEFGKLEYPSHFRALSAHLVGLGKENLGRNLTAIRGVLKDLDTSQEIADFLGMDIGDVIDLELVEIVNDIQRGVMNIERAASRHTTTLEEAASLYAISDDSFVRSAQKAQYTRLVQESARIAAEKGKKTVLFPTGETVSKIEGWGGVLEEGKRKSMMKPYDKLNKDIKKTLGVEPTKVTIQGHEWWEVQIPESYLKGEQEITAFGKGGKMRILKRKSR